MAVTTSLSFDSRMAASGGVCEGQVGDYPYDLAPLSKATGGQDVTCFDSAGNLFFYRPCQVLQQQQCQTITDSTPAACLKDTRYFSFYLMNKSSCNNATQHKNKSNTSLCLLLFFLLPVKSRNSMTVVALHRFSGRRDLKATTPAFSSNLMEEKKTEDWTWNSFVTTKQVTREIFVRLINYKH